jgi:hypothetical protein
MIGGFASSSWRRGYRQTGPIRSRPGSTTRGAGAQAGARRDAVKEPDGATRRGPRLRERETLKTTSERRGTGRKQRVGGGKNSDREGSGPVV